MFCRFTDLDGDEVWIVARWVTMVRTPLPGRYDLAAKTVISIGQREQAVRETVEEVKSMLERHAEA